MILITSPEKPLPRVGKGTPARKAAFATYKSEINKLFVTNIQGMKLNNQNLFRYAAVESNSGGELVNPLKVGVRKTLVIGFLQKLWKF